MWCPRSAIFPCFFLSNVYFHTQSIRIKPAKLPQFFSFKKDQLPIIGRGYAWPQGCKPQGWVLHPVTPCLWAFNVFFCHWGICYLLSARALASALALAINVIATVCTWWQIRQGKYYTCGVQIYLNSFCSRITRLFGYVRVRGFGSVSLSVQILQASRENRQIQSLIWEA